jgi:hypothetical protein
MQNAISINMALTMAGPKPPSRASSLRSKTQSENMPRPQSSTSRKFSLYSGISDRPLGWKPRKTENTARDMIVRRWDGATRRSTEWDSLRKVSTSPYAMRMPCANTYLCIGC